MCRDPQSSNEYTSGSAFHNDHGDPMPKRSQKITSRVAKDFIEILLPFALENSLDEPVTVRSRDR